MSISLFSGNKEFIQIYNRYINTVYRVCFMYMKNKEDTEDAVQTTFVKYLEYKGEFKDSEHLKACFIVTASNVCKNNLKHWWRKTVDINSLEERSVRNINDTSFLLEKILSLPKKYKLIIYMYYYEGYKIKEIANKLNMKDSTVKSYLHRGRNLLKEVIEEDENEE